MNLQTAEREPITTPALKVVFMKLLSGNFLQFLELDHHQFVYFSVSATDHSFDGGLDDSSQGSTALAQVSLFVLLQN